jgi:hypothetical protein
MLRRVAEDRAGDEKRSRLSSPDILDISYLIRTKKPMRGHN